MSINNIIIAGAGTMGYSMAQIFAQYNYNVTVYDLSKEALNNGEKHINENVSTLIQQKEISKEQGEKILDNLVFTYNLDCFKDCDLVVECIIEDLEIKKQFYKQISNLVNDNTIIATNTSGLSINELSNAVNKPERFIGMHWFNPSHIIPLIEIIKGDKTNSEIAKNIYDLAININKKPVIVNKDVPGFVANRLQFAVLREALALVEDDVISIEDIDNVMKYGLGFRYACLGPLEVADFGGLDTFYHISEYLMKDLCDKKEVPSLLQECYDNNEYGVKSKKGFYDYSNGKDIKATKQRDEKFIKVLNALYK